MNLLNSTLKEIDPEIFDVLQKELGRQRTSLEMIASENFVSRAILESVGSVLTNKYSEGYPSKRYYGGNQFIDVSESLAIERAKKLFNAEHANVQPHAGSPANAACYFATLGNKGKIMGLRLDQGGHLTHGHPVNFSGMFYQVASYGVDKETEMLDYDSIRKQALQEKPNALLAGYTAYPREIDWKAFSEIAQEIGAYFICDISHLAGMIAAGVYHSPVPYADVVMTTTHKTLRGPRGAIILSKKEDRLAKIDGLDEKEASKQKDLAGKIDRAVFPGMQGGPLDHVIAAKAICFKQAMTGEFVAYQKQIKKNAKILGEALVGYGFRLVSGGTESHMVLVDLTNKKITGKEAQTLLDSVDITINKNTIPYDTLSPFVTSGIRIGTPALTTRGMKESEMKEIALLINKAIENRTDKQVLEKIKADVHELCNKFPLYPWL